MRPSTLLGDSAGDGTCLGLGGVLRFVYMTVLAYGAALGRLISFGNALRLSGDHVHFLTGKPIVRRVGSRGGGGPTSRDGAAIRLLAPCAKIRRGCLRVVCGSCSPGVQKKIATGAAPRFLSRSMR